MHGQYYKLYCLVEGGYAWITLQAILSSGGGYAWITLPAILSSGGWVWMDNTTSYVI